MRSNYICYSSFFSFLFSSSLILLFLPYIKANNNDVTVIIIPARPAMSLSFNIKITLARIIKTAKLKPNKVPLRSEIIFESMTLF